MIVASGLVQLCDALAQGLSAGSVLDLRGGAFQQVEGASRSLADRVD